MGRPRKTDNEKIHIRFSIGMLDSTIEILKRRADELGIRHCILGRELIELGLGLRTELSKQAGGKQD